MEGKATQKGIYPMSHSNTEPTARDLGRRARRERDLASRRYERIFERYMAGTATQRAVAAASAKVSETSLALVTAVGR